MRILKIIGIILLALVGIFLIMGLFAPKEVSVVRSTVIDSPKTMVFNTVNDLSTWESWSPWKEMDSTLQTKMGDKTVGEGATYSWTSEEVGSGNMSIISSTPSDSLKTQIEFDGMGEAEGSWFFEEAENGTRASWGMHFETPYPWNTMNLFYDMEEAISKDFDRGLELLKQKVEEEAKMMTQKYNGYEVKTVELPARHFVAMRKKVAMDKVSEFYTQSLGQIFQAVQENDLEMDGMPCGLYYSWDEENNESDMAGAIPVKEKAELDGYTSITLPAGKALLVDYYGDYSNIGAAHEAIDEYMKATGVEAGAPAVEQYVTDPSEEPDTTKWLTKIYYPVKG